jgi:hypothetical protein
LIIIQYTTNYEDLYSFIIEQFPEYNFEKTIDYELLKIESYSQDRLNEIKEYIFLKYEGTLLTDHYINNTTKMDFLCKNGHKFSSTWTNITTGIFCTKCNKSNRMMPKIEEFCKQFNYELLSEYTRAKDKLEWKCTGCDALIERCWDTMRLTKGHKCS